MVTQLTHCLPALATKNQTWRRPTFAAHIEIMIGATRACARVLSLQLDNDVKAHSRTISNYTRSRGDPSENHPLKRVQLTNHTYAGPHIYNKGLYPLSQPSYHLPCCMLHIVSQETDYIGIYLHDALIPPASAQRSPTAGPAGELEFIRLPRLRQTRNISAIQTIFVVAHFLMLC